MRRAAPPATRAGLDRVLAISRVGKHGGFAFLPSGMVYSVELNVFPFDTFAAFAVLQSRVHEVWARFFGSTLEERLRYTPSDCFETFPFPPGWHAGGPVLERVGSAYYEFRASLMLDNEEGLTKTYNRFHDRNDKGPSVTKLRELHADMDRAVLDAYGWTDIPTRCEFLLDHESDEDETTSRRRKPYRYRWPDTVCDDVLARLMALNQERAGRS